MNDVIIVGGGMVGAALGLALADGGLRVALVEARAPDRGPFPMEHDLRVSAITLASQQFLMRLGAWAAIARQRVSPFREMHVWDATGSGAVHFDSAEIGEPLLGHIVENRVITAALWARLDEQPGVERYCPASARRLVPTPDRVGLVLEDGRELTGRLLIAADGSTSWVRREMAIPTREWDSGQQALVAVVRTRGSHRETAWQRFLPDGPLAFLPLSDGSSSIVWSTDAVHADYLLHLDDRRFLAELQANFGDGLGEMTAAGPRAAFPLHLLFAQDYVQHRLALVGDAAHTIHPLAGQGVNLGFMDAAALAEVVLAAHARRRDIGALATLRRYERARKGENLLMIAAMEGFQRLFGSRLAPVRFARNLGLTLTDQLPPLKALFMRHAMGLRGDLPALARPATLGSAAPDSL